MPSMVFTGQYKIYLDDREPVNPCVAGFESTHSKILCILLGIKNSILKLKNIFNNYFM